MTSHDGGLIRLCRGRISPSEADDAGLARPTGTPECLREKINFACRLNMIWFVHAAGSYILLPFFRIVWFALAIPPCQEGRIAIVTNVGWDAVDATERETSACGCGR